MEYGFDSKNNLSALKETINGITRETNYSYDSDNRLDTLTAEGHTIDYTYDANGMRTKKVKTNASGTVTDTYLYVYNGSQLSQMTKNGQTLNFFYDGEGRPAYFTYNNATYYYVTNLQGDVIAILDSTGAVMVNYHYDAYGVLLQTGGTMATTLGTLNPLTYRGYVYDHETGLYYLQSRYYNPTIRQFISPDAFISTGQGYLGYNMFAYCGNNPVSRADPTGYRMVLVDILEGDASTAAANESSLPTTGVPGSSQTIYNPDGTPKQKRWYGPDGKPVRDRDYNHQGVDIKFPHDHEWKNGERQKDHLDPSPDYEFLSDPLVGAGLVFICGIGIVVIALDDISGIGISDNFFLVPLAGGITKGIKMIFD